MEVKDLWGKLSTAGDVAVAAIGYAAGFTIDNYYFGGGLPPGTVAAVASVGAVGVKKAFDAIIETFQGRDRYKGEPAELERRAETLLRYMERVMDKSADRTSHPLYSAHAKLGEELFVWRSGIIDDSEFYACLSFSTITCREQLKLDQ